MGCVLLNQPDFFIFYILYFKKGRGREANNKESGWKKECQGTRFDFTQSAKLQVLFHYKTF